jgi:hypothetical protein
VAAWFRSVGSGRDEKKKRIIAQNYPFSTGTKKGRTGEGK